MNIVDSVIRGMASIGDAMASFTLFPQQRTPEEILGYDPTDPAQVAAIDAAAIQSDWKAVGDDMRTVFGRQ